MLDYYRDYFKQGGTYTMEGIAATSRPQLLVQWIRESISKGDNALDIGCGDMYLASQFPELNWTGLDICTDKAKGNAIQHDLMETPYPVDSGSQDLVICSEVMEHVWSPEVIYDEAYRVLRPGGTLLVSTPNPLNIDTYIGNLSALWYQPGHPHAKEHIRLMPASVHADLAGDRFIIQACTTTDHVATRTFYNAAQRMYEAGIVKDLVEADKLLGTAFPEFGAGVSLKMRKDAR